MVLEEEKAVQVEAELVVAVVAVGEAQQAHRVALTAIKVQIHTSFGIMTLPGQGNLVLEEVDKEEQPGPLVKPGTPYMLPEVMGLYQVKTKAVMALRILVMAVMELLIKRLRPLFVMAVLVLYWCAGVIRERRLKMAWCNQIFAEIYENKVMNIMVCDNYEMANYLARCTYGEEAFAEDTTLYPLAIGDTYENGHFYHVSEDGTKEEVLRNSTEKEQILYLTAENEALTEAVVDLDYRQCMAELELL